MRKPESSLGNMTITLVGVAVVSALLLAIVNHITKGAIEAQAAIAAANGINKAMGNDELTEIDLNSIIQYNDDMEVTNYYEVHKMADARGNYGGAAVETTAMGFNGNIKVIVGFDADGKVAGYTILGMSETPGLGAKVSSWFQADGKGSIIGKQMDTKKPLTLTKDGGDIDGITASTITSRAFLNAVNKAYAAYTDEEVEAVTSASQQY